MTDRLRRMAEDPEVVVAVLRDLITLVRERRVVDGSLKVDTEFVEGEPTSRTWHTLNLILDSEPEPAAAEAL